LGLRYPLRAISCWQSTNVITRIQGDTFRAAHATAMQGETANNAELNSDGRRHSLVAPPVCGATRVCWEPRLTCSFPDLPHSFYYKLRDPFPSSFLRARLLF
jgi:hypothetical protein